MTLTNTCIIIIIPVTKTNKQILVAGQFSLHHILVTFSENCNCNIYYNMSKISDILWVLILNTAVHKLALCNFGVGKC